MSSVIDGLVTRQMPRERKRLLDGQGNPIETDDGLLIPTQATVAAIYNAISRTYSYRYDEAVKNSWENSLAMRRDAFIMACLDERYRAVTQSAWHIECEDEEDEGQLGVAEEMTAMVKKIPKFVSMLRNLEECVWYGRYGSQIATGQVDIGAGIMAESVTYHRPLNGDKIMARWDGVPAIMINPVYRDLYDKSGYTLVNRKGLTLGNEDPTGIDGTVVWGERAPLLLLDRPELRNRFLISQFERDDADYYDGEMAGMVAGVGVRSRIYWFYYLKMEFLGYMTDYFKKVGTLGLLIVPFEEGNRDAQLAAERNIRNAGNRSGLAVPVPPGQDPKAYSPMVVNGSTAGIEALRFMVDSYFERHIERYICGQNMSDGKDNDSGLGGSGRAEFAGESKYMKIKGDCELLEETLTVDLLKNCLHRLNYPNQPFTYRFKFGVADPKAKDKLEAGTKLVAAGVRIKADELREVGGFTEPGVDDEVVGDQMQPEAPFGKGLDGEPLKTPMGFGQDQPSEKPNEQKQPEEKADGQYQREHDAMNDRQFAAAMERLAKIEANMTDARQQNYARSNDEAVMLLNQRINDLAMSRYERQGGMELHLPAESQFVMRDVKIAGIEELVAAIREQKAPVVENVVNVPEAKVENIVNVPQTKVTVEAAKVNIPATVVNVPEQSAPVVHVNVPEPPEMEVTEIERDSGGFIKRLIRKVMG